MPTTIWSPSQLRFFTRTRKQKQNLDHVGQASDIQTFFEAPDFDEADPRWVEYAPPSLPLVKKQKHEGAAVQIYKRRNVNLAREGFYVQKVRLQSPYLRDALKETLESFGVTYRDDRYGESVYPHRGLYFIRDRIAELGTKAEDETTRSHCELLCSVIEEIFDPMFDELEALEREHKITYQYLWTLFPEGFVFAKKNDTIPPQGLKVTRVVTDQYRMKITCSGVIYDGYRYGTVEWDWRIYHFDGAIDTSAIPGFQYIDLAQDEGLRKRLLERGRSALDLQSIRYMTYKPDIAAPDRTNDLTLGERDEHERVIIDPHLFRQRSAHYTLEPLPSYRKLRGEGPTEDLEDINNDDFEYGESGDFSASQNGKPSQIAQKDNLQYEVKRRYNTRDRGRRRSDPRPSREREVLRRPTQAEIELNRRAVLDSEEYLLTMHPRVCGYSLDRRVWTEFYIDQLRPIETDKSVFDKVVLDDGKKDIVKTLVESHRELLGHYDDLIPGKGQCLLVILSGPPGTGKTLMAESLAEHLGCPLLRADSHFIQQNRFELIQGYSATLAQFLRDATEWGGLVLFDEPDFLFQNQETGADRKDLLAFLRQAEYFRGIIFLTTNLTRTIDPAVISRTQIYLSFPALTGPMRTRVWENFVERLPADVGTLSPEAIARLATWQINGREIKNILNMSVSFCRKKQQKLTLDVVENLLGTICPSARREDEKPLLTNGANGTAEKNLTRDMFLLDL